MGMIFGDGTQAPTRLNSVKLNQSCLGLPLTTVIGTGKVQQALLWLDGFSSVVAPSGGKGAGKGSAGYIYSADVIAALCNGPILAVRDFWADSSWIQNSTTSEPYTIGAPGIYTPQQASSFTSDQGVSVPVAYNQIFNDLNAPGSNTLIGVDNTPMTLVPYGEPLNQGEYSINVETIGTFVLTGCGAAALDPTSGQIGTTYLGSAFGAVNSLSGYTFIVTDFSNSENNGSYTCISNTASTILLTNAAGVAETHAGSAAEMGVQYYFSVADQDAGTEVIINYSFSLPYIFAQENDIIPQGGVIHVGSPWWYGVDYGVTYYSSGDVYNPLNGTALVQVPNDNNVSQPTQAGTYKFFSSGKGSAGSTYIFAEADVANEVQITYQYQDMQPYQNSKGQSTGIPETLQFTLFSGEHGQSPWSLLTDSYPGQALGYSNTALALFNPMNLGSSGQVHNNTYEVQTSDMYGGGILDCNLVQCIWQVLTNSVWGLGSGKQPFPAEIMDNGPDGTWGRPNGTNNANSRITNSTAWNWSAANSYFISPVLDKQETAASTMGDWLEAGMVAAFMSEGLLKLVPYGDTSVAGNGCTWVAPSSFVCALDDTCYVKKEGEDPVKISRSPWQDAHNNVQIKWDNRSNQYAPEITPDSDQSSIDRYGLRLEDPKDFSFIHTLAAATFSASMRVKRGVNIRNAFKFTLPFTYSYLEVMDIITISTTSNWNTTPGNVNLNIVNRPVRLMKIEDDPIEGLIIDAEDYPYGVGQPVLFNKGISAGVSLTNAYKQPGNAEVVMFEATSRLTGFTGNQIWIGALGTSDAWGGCQIWASRDGLKYAQIGEITTSARIGEIGDEPSTAIGFPLGSDPDTINSLVVNMVENSAALDAGTMTDADTNVTLCFCDGELIAYSAAAISGEDQYTMNGYIRRGCMGSTISSHAPGGLFMRLDNSIFKYTYDPTWVGVTLYFKFLSFNSSQNCLQGLEDVDAVLFTVPGSGPGTVDASSGLIINNNNFNVGAGLLGWSPYTTTNDTTINKGRAVTGSTMPSGVSRSYTYARWTGYLISSVTGTHTIGVNSGDGCNLYIAGQSVFTPNLATHQQALATLGYTQSGTITLTKGVYYPVVLEWEHGDEGTFGSYYAECQLIWTPPSGSKALIPTANLSSVNTSVNGYLVGTWWNGTSGLWYPSGVGAVDLASPGVINNSLDNIGDGSTYVRVLGVNFVDHTFHTSQAFVNQGSIACNADFITAAPTYTSTTTSITWSWSAFTVYATSGTTWSVASGTAPAITGLTAGKTYYFSMYAVLSTSTASIVWLLSDKGTPTGTATSSIAQQMTEVNADGNVPVLLNMTAATPASGSGGGSGGGGAGCFTATVPIKTPTGYVEFGQLPAKFELVNETGIHWAELIVHEDYEGWMVVLEGDRLVTTNHVMKAGEDWVPAASKYASLGRRWFKGTVYNVHVITDDPDSQHFVLWNGDTAHNLKIGP